MVKVYSVQDRIVVEKLEKGEVHRQDWRSTAVYDERLSAYERGCHRRAYLWMAGQYAKRKRRRLKSAPIWLTFNEQNARAGLKADKDEAIIQLAIPCDELLVSQYRRNGRWLWERVLENKTCCEHEGPCFSEVCFPTRHALRATWGRLFPPTGTKEEWQAIVDRLEPSWYRGQL